MEGVLFLVRNTPLTSRTENIRPTINLLAALQCNLKYITLKATYN